MISYLYLFIGLVALSIVGLLLTETRRGQVLAIYYLCAALFMLTLYISTMLQRVDVVLLYVLVMFSFQLFSFRRSTRGDKK